MCTVTGPPRMYTYTENVVDRYETKPKKYYTALTFCSQLQRFFRVFLFNKNEHSLKWNEMCNSHDIFVCFISAFFSRNYFSYLCFVSLFGCKNINLCAPHRHMHLNVWMWPNYCINRLRNPKKKIEITNSVRVQIQILKFLQKKNKYTKEHACKTILNRLNWMLITKSYDSMQTHSPDLFSAYDYLHCNSFWHWFFL